MLFKDRIQFKHGYLKRGDRVMYRTMQGTFLGAYKEEGSKFWKYMILVDAVEDADGLPVITEFIETTTDLRWIICKVQQEKAIEGQMMLC